MYKILFVLLFFPVAGSFAQVNLRGIIVDKEGERLPQAHIYFYPDSITTTSSNNGSYQAVLKPGKKTVQVTFVGYEAFTTTFVLRRDTTVSILLRQTVNQLDEVVISGERDYQTEIFDSNSTSTHVLTKDQISSIPVLGGEADVIKTLQLLPGTVRGVEGTSDLFVRGGQADQNLVLLDGAPIYNTGHLFGFLSVFNPDILEKVEAINGGFPANYGGRLSSILNVESVSRVADRTSLSGDIGLIASRVFLEQPLVKDKASIWISGRRTYIDQVVKAVGEDLPYFFYDLNGKLLLRPGERDEIQFSYYGGRDILDLFRDRNGDGDGFTSSFQSGNSSQSLRWKRQLPSDWVANVTLFRTNYNYDILNSFEENRLTALSTIEDYGGSLLLQKDSLRQDGVFKAGFEWIAHSVSPNIINSEGNFAELIESSTTAGKVANEVAVHAQYEFSPFRKLRINTGFRGSTGVVTGRQYFFPEPRFSMRYALSETEALKASYSRMVQYIHRISNSAVSTPTDVWYPVTDSIQPQSSHQVALAYQRNLSKQGFFFSTEGYYKTMDDLIGFEEGTNLFFNNDFESKLIQGQGRSYGLEFLLRKETGKLTGWLSYTLSWSWRSFDEINEGEWFRARYDRRHNGALVMQYQVTKRLSASLVWEFISGARFTPVIGQYALLAPSLSGAELIPVFSEVNGVKLADTHRLDLGLKFLSKPGRKFQWHWFAGVYNVYNRANPVGITIEQDENDGSLRYLQPGLFGLLPFISYGFKL